MLKVIVFGATGHIGRATVRELIAQGYVVTVVVRNEQKAKEFAHLPVSVKVADITKPTDLVNICKAQEVVVSALGKSVSLTDRSKTSFMAIDFVANINILAEAQKCKVQKFIYVSAFGAENYPTLDYFKVHHEVEQRIVKSGLAYTILRPPAVFSAFLDLIDTAQRNRLMSIGGGDKKTNPIAETDLAKIMANAIRRPSSIIDAGGQRVYTRLELLEIIQQEVNGHRRVRKVSIKMVKMVLPVLRLLDKNRHDKLAFYIKVMQHDILAPPIGKTAFEDYIRQKVQAKALPLSANG